MELVEQKKDQLDSMLRLQNYQLECAEIKSQIQDKRKAIDATQYMGSDLGGVMALQRRLSTMEGALSVLEPKLLHLQVREYLQFKAQRQKYSSKEMHKSLFAIVGQTHHNFPVSPARRRRRSIWPRPTRVEPWTSWCRLMRSVWSGRS